MNDIVISAIPSTGHDEAHLRRLAGSLGAASSHPVSRAVAATVLPADRLILSKLREFGGQGVIGETTGRKVLLGRPAFLSEHGISIPTIPDHDGPLVGVADNDIFAGWLLLADEPRAEAAVALADLRSLGLTRQILLTGDRMAVAQHIGDALGITDIRAELTPEHKLTAVHTERVAGFRPLVVGDGINDALALKAGTVGVAMGANGTDVALASADLVLTTSDLRRLATGIRLSRRCRTTIAVNVAIGLGWTAVIIGAAVLGAVGPITAVILHNVGTIAVIINSGRLLAYDENA